MKKVLKILLKVLAGILVFLLTAAAAIMLFLRYWPSVGRTPDKESEKQFAENSDTYRDGRFHNENETASMSGKPEKRSSQVRPKSDLPVVREDQIPEGREGGLTVRWYGHSSLLVQLGEKNIFLDPVLSMRTSPVSFAGPKRFSELALDPADVPELDVVFISHDHYDHLDHATIRAIDKKVRHYIVPSGVESYLYGWGIDREKVHSLGWWESIELEGVSYTLTPSQHFSGRNPLRSNSTLWGGVRFSDASHSVYYTGDGGYYDVFSRVYDAFGETDLMLTECGQYDRAWSAIHMRPEETAQAAADAHAWWFIPIHYGAFVLANHAWNDPPARAAETAEKLGIRMASPRIGEAVDYEEIENYCGHWWEKAE